jgi:predicted dienelactone hydrolase
VKAVERGTVGPSGSHATLPEQTKRLAELPSPTGPFAIGRTTFYWVDSARAETLTADPNDKRELMVTLWYPAQKLKDLSRAACFLTPNRLAVVRDRSHLVKAMTFFATNGMSQTDMARAMPWNWSRRQALLT